MIIDKERLKSILQEPLLSRSGRSFYFKCPECGHNECGISIYKPNHPWGCFRKSKCGATGNIYSLKRKLGIFDNDRELYSTAFKKRSLDIKPVIEFEKPTIRKLPILSKRITNSNYLNNRGFTEKDYDYFKPYKSRIIRSYIVFPIVNWGHNVAYVARLYKDQDLPKYNNDTAEFEKIVGNLDNVYSKTVILVEGIFDVINIVRKLNLYNSDSLQCVCTFGAKVSENQIKALINKGVEDIILIFDNDVVEITKKSAILLSNYFNVKVASIVGNNDAGDASLLQILDAIENAVSAFEFFTSKLTTKIN